MEDNALATNGRLTTASATTAAGASARARMRLPLLDFVFSIIVIRFLSLL